VTAKHYTLDQVEIDWLIGVLRHVNTRQVNLCQSTRESSRGKRTKNKSCATTAHLADLRSTHWRTQIHYDGINCHHLCYLSSSTENITLTFAAWNSWYHAIQRDSWALSTQWTQQQQSTSMRGRFLAEMFQWRDRPYWQCCIRPYTPVSERKHHCFHEINRNANLMRSSSNKKHTKASQGNNKIPSMRYIKKSVKTCSASINNAEMFSYQTIVKCWLQ